MSVLMSAKDLLLPTGATAAAATAAAGSGALALDLVLLALGPEPELPEPAAEAAWPVVHSCPAMVFSRLA